LHVILAQSEGDGEIDLVAGEVVARETFSILTTTAVIRPNTIINLFLGRTNPQHADWLNAILPRIYVMNNNISADSLRAQNVDIQPLRSEDFPEMDIQPLCLVKYDMKKPFSGHRAIVL